MPVKKIKLAHTEHQTTVDFSTGEILASSKTHITGKEQEPPFVKMYLDHIVTIYNLPKSSSSLLLALAQRVTYDNVVQINKWLKLTIANDLDIKEQSISNSITKFVETNVLRRIGGGTYKLNPHIFAKGAWQYIKLMRADWLKLSITYSEDGTPTINHQNEPALKLA